jgi:ATP-dependent DNA helicase DinG
MPSMSPRPSKPQPQASSAADGSADAPAYARTQGIDAKLLQKARLRLEFLYGEVAKTWPGFIARPGQYQMMQTALLTFLSAKAPQDEHRPGDHLAQLEAGTGTGKTVAYCLAAIVASELLQRTVVVSTATVALQEQLFHKDLPRLAKIVPELRFDILKGRGRYVCESRLLGAVNDEAQDSLLDDDHLAAFADSRTTSRGVVRDRGEAMRWFKDAAKKLQAARWDGDIDTLEQPPDPQDWRVVQANAHACNGGQCVHFKTCAFFRARRQAASATIQVANHALILATLQTDSTLIDPGATLFVFDEAHHLPNIAADQFSVRARLGASASLLTSLRSLVNRHGREMAASARPDPVAFGQTISECTDRLAVLERYCAEAEWVSADKPVHRFAQGLIPAPLVSECEQLGVVLGSIASVVARVAAALTENDDESKSPAEREQQSRAGVELGVYQSRLASLQELFSAWATHDTVPWAKWIEFVAAPPGAPAGVNTDVWLCTSPMTAAKILARGLWKEVSAAVCTSATLTACGSFDFFDRLSGMNRFPERRALVVASPFDYATQGELRIAPMLNSPKSAEFSAELCRTLPTLLREHKHGQLVLFTSKRQMQACHAALPKDLLKQVQVQGERSRNELLKEHGRRVAAGNRSIIFGLQSFGEGIDLPGPLCEHVVIDKLPFTPPNSPVEEALSEWLTTHGRDSFAEISVPRAAMKLAQWAGRGVRTITDRAVITVCDTRLVTTGYGKNILAGLPPFPVVRSERV